MFIPVIRFDVLNHCHTYGLSVLWQCDHGQEPKKGPLGTVDLESPRVGPQSLTDRNLMDFWPNFVWLPLSTVFVSCDNDTERQDGGFHKTGVNGDNHILLFIFTGTDSRILRKFHIGQGRRTQRMLVHWLFPLEWFLTHRDFSLWLCS